MDRTTPTPHPAVSPGSSGSKAARFRALLKARELTFLMEAHDGLSAKIVEEAGFPGIWASGLTVSAALGVRDSNEASWTQVLEAMDADGSLGQASLLDMLSRLIAAGHRIGVAYVLGGWLDVDDAFDLARARNFT